MISEHKICGKCFFYLMAQFNSISFNAQTSMAFKQGFIADASCGQHQVTKEGVM